MTDKPTLYVWSDESTRALYIASADPSTDGYSDKDEIELAVPYKRRTDLALSKLTNILNSVGVKVISG